MAGPFLKRRTIVAAKAESEIGTAEVLAAEDAFANVYNAEIVPDVPVTKRPLAGSLEQAAAIPGACSAKISFWVELAGHGASGLPQWATLLLPACGGKFSGSTFHLSSAKEDWAWLTIGVYKDGIYETAAGCQGTVTFEMENGKFGWAKFEFQGVYQGRGDAELFAGVQWPSIHPPRTEGLTLEIGGLTPIATSKVMIALGRKVFMRPDITKLDVDNNPVGYISALITDAEITGSLDPESVLVATDDRIAAWREGTEATLEVVVGTQSNNMFIFTAPKLQYIKIAGGDRDGVYLDNIDFQLNADMGGSNVLPYDNALSIAFG